VEGADFDGGIALGVVAGDESNVCVGIAESRPSKFDLFA
jgi:hypothetical protein